MSDDVAPATDPLWAQPTVIRNPDGSSYLFWAARVNLPEQGMGPNDTLVNQNTGQQIDPYQGSRDRNTEAERSTSSKGEERGEVQAQQEGEHLHEQTRQEECINVKQGLDAIEMFRRERRADLTPEEHRQSWRDAHGPPNDQFAGRPISYVPPRAPTRRNQNREETPGCLGGLKGRLGKLPSRCIVM